MNKKFVSILLAGIMVLALAACGNHSSSTAPAPSSAAPAPSSSTAGEPAATDGAKPANFPKKNITIIVPYDAGGGVDITTRLVTDAAGKDYFDGKSLIVENRPGGGAVVGHTAVANADPDGYTLLAYTSAIVNNPLLKEVTYELGDFKTLGMVCFDPEILTVPASAPYKTFDEFIAYAKENTVKLATPGHSTAHHIAAMQFAKEYGLRFEYLHNDSSAVQLQQLMGGHCDAAFMAVGETVSAINDGTIIGLAMGDENRNPNIPDVPTFKECGGTMVSGAFRGFACRADVPDDIYNYLVAEFDKIITSDKFIQAMNDAAIPYSYRNAADFQAYAESVSASLEPLVPELKAG